MNILQSSGYSLTDKIEVQSTDDPTKFLHVIAKSARIKFTSVAKYWILAALKGLKESKSPGPDKISAMVLKDVVELICVLLALTFNESLWRGVCNVGLPSLR